MKHKNIHFIIKTIIFLFMLVLLFGCSSFGNLPPTPTAETEQADQNRNDNTYDAADQQAAQSTTGTDNSQDNSTNDPGTPASAPLSGFLKVHFIDVGQADSILVQAPSGKNILIDTGNNNDDTLVVNYLKNQDISKLDIVVGTHPHEDHIGGLDTIIKTFDIGQIVMPNATTTTQTFKDVLTAVQNKGLKITTAKPGVILDLGAGINATVIAPNGTKYDNLNNYSAVIHLTFGSTSFLFTGDAESISESETLKAGANVKSTVLKVGHHGSSSSTSQAFLDQVRPKYAVIMCGKDNDYGHPHQETLKKLAKVGAKVYRTDLNGTIVATSDGASITWTGQLFQ